MSACGGELGRRFHPSRPLRRLAIAATAAALLLGAGCSTQDGAGSSQTTTSTSATREATADLTRAADLTVEAGTGRLEVSTDLTSGPGADHTIKGKIHTSYTYDRGGEVYRGELSMQMVVALDYTFVTDGRTFYVQSPLLTERGVAEGTWVAQDADELRAEDEGVDLLVRPTDVLDLLRGEPPAAADEGTVDIDGVQTRHLHLVTTIDRLGSGLSSERKVRLARAVGGLAAADDPGRVLDDGISLQVYLLPDGRVRRLDLTMEVSPTVHDAYHSIYDFTELGSATSIAVPPAGPVIGADEVPKGR